jgi:hypothetical protein
VHRHTRAHVREQRSWWIWKRMRQIRRYEQDSEVPNRAHLPGRLNKQDPRDCGNPQCGICHAGGYERREGRERLQVASELESLKGWIG